MKLLLATTIALLPTAVIAQQFTPEQVIGVMVSSSENLDVRVDDALLLSLNDDEEEDDDGRPVIQPDDDGDPKGPQKAR